MLENSMSPLTQRANRTKRPLPNLSPQPEEMPHQQLKELQAAVVNETPASRERIPRMAECGSVNIVNSVWIC